MIANGYNVAAIGYHGSDQFNNIYANARRTYYGVTGNPTAFFDGGNAQVGGIPSGSMYSYYTGPTAAAAAIPCNFELEIYGTANGSTYDIMAVIRMVEPSRDHLIQRLLPGVPERGVAKVMAERDRFCQIFVETECLCNRSSDLRDLEGVGQARSVVIARRDEKDLGFMLQSPK